MPFDATTIDTQLSKLLLNISALTLGELQGALKLLSSKTGLPPRAVFTLPLQSQQRTEWSQCVRLGRAYGEGGTAGPVAAQFSFVQLFNPATSGKSLLVYAAVASPAAAGELQFSIDTVASGAAALPVSRNLLGGGPATVVLATQGTNAALLNFSGTSFHRALVPLGTPYVVPVQGGFLAEVPPGFGVSAWCAVANTALTASFLWAEVDGNWPR